MAAFSVNEYKRRLACLRDCLRKQGLAACVCVSPELLYYYCGYEGHTHFSDQFMVFGSLDTIPTLIHRDVDGGIAQESCWIEDRRCYHYGHEDPFVLLQSVVAEKIDSKCDIGVDWNTHALKGGKAFSLQGSLSNWRLVDFSQEIQGLRLVKSPEELIYLRRAGEFATIGLERAREIAAPGVSEISLAGELEAAMRNLGSEYPAMPSWVSSGPRTIGAHKTPTSRVIERGERVKLEFAGVCARYHAVTMQTFWIGKSPPDETIKIYRAAAEALRAGESAIAVGHPVATSEAAAFSVLAQHGFDLKWHSRFGYGVGIAYPPTWLESLDITQESAQHFALNQSFTLHIAVKDPFEGQGLMLGGAYLLGDSGLEVLSGGALDLMVV